VIQAYGHPQFQENTRERNVSCYTLASALKHASLSVSLSSILPKPERQGDVFGQEGKYTWRGRKKKKKKEKKKKERRKKKSNIGRNRTFTISCPVYRDLKIKENSIFISRFEAQ